MNTRSGVKERDAFGPAPGNGTLWVITTKQGETLRSWGASAYLACSNAGLTLGQVADIVEQPKVNSDWVRRDN